MMTYKYLASSAMVAACMAAFVNCGGQHEEAIEAPNGGTRAMGGTTSNSVNAGGALSSNGGNSSSLPPASTLQGGTSGSSGGVATQGGSLSNSTQTTSFDAGGYHATGGVPSSGGMTSILGLGGNGTSGSGGDASMAGYAGSGGNSVMGGNAGSGGYWMGGSSGTGGKSNVAGAAGYTSASSCDIKPDWCCRVCEQQARTAFYVDADGQRVSCADPSCGSWYCYTLIRWPKPAEDIACWQVGEWQCVRDRLFPYDYFPVQPVCP